MNLLNLGWCLGLENKIVEALEQFDKALMIHKFSIDA